MARYGERLPYASHSGEPPAVALSPGQWRALEANLGISVLLGARDEFEALCNDYLSSELLERSAVRLADLKKCATETEKSLGPFFAFAFGSLTPPSGVSDDTWKEFRERFDATISQFAIPATVNEEGEPQTVALLLKASTVTEIAIRLSACLSTISNGGGQDEVFDGTAGLEVGAAFRAFLQSAKAWAKRNSLPHGAIKSIDDSVAPFPAFLYSALQMLPEESRPTVSSAAALAAHMKRKGRL
ncbi:hypothetical protein OCK02_02170 [Rhizobium sp. TRM96647]|uniref:hypothetical protein n=1 Tax=unclassified Rhizobium TaxID=2613769 RepID=UPI0021E7A233|nr:MULTISPECIES: hypothetical protein [unclassified Rhizobium]MCV3734995.1 hypothetical protein [Rhizobium sp. TRM96647]MCV3757365.1 hypothetical protein [Rhizobium sp. TRM96650]